MGKTFHSLGKSKIPEADNLQDNTTAMNQLSLENEDFVFDVPIEVEEIEHAIKSLPNSKAAGHDGVMGEHLKFDGKKLKNGQSKSLML